MPKSADVPKLAAVANPVPATDPLSSIPSRKAPIMKAFMTIIPIKHKIRGIHSNIQHDRVSSSPPAKHVSPIQRKGDSGERANLAKHEAVAPRTPLRRANRNMVNREILCRFGFVPCRNKSLYTILEYGARQQVDSSSLRAPSANLKLNGTH